MAKDKYKSFRKIPLEEIPLLPRLLHSMTLQEVGDRYGVSRERIRQLVKNNGGITKVDRSVTFKCKTPKCPNLVSVVRSNREYCYACLSYMRKQALNPNRRKNRRKIEITDCYRCERRRGNIKGLCRICYTYIYIKSHPALYAKHIKRSNERFQEKMFSDPEFREKTLKKQRERYQRQKNLKLT